MARRIVAAVLCWLCLFGTVSLPVFVTGCQEEVEIDTDDDGPLEEAGDEIEDATD